LQRLVDELGLGSSVVLAGATRDVAGELDAASIFVLSSRHEGFPMTILEAMSRGVPVVSFDCPHGPGEMITNEREGLLVPPGDVDGLGDALGRLMDDPVARCRMGDHALRTSARYDRDEVHGAWSRLLCDLVPD
ncbi:MAG: glycosyltransferase, partial [Nonomuraea sp.]|nr:glycosyltransferase [Nonomuraea sp.]